MKRSRIIILATLAVFTLVMFILGIVGSTKASNAKKNMVTVKDDITISQDFTVTSKVQNVLLQSYTSTFKGVLCNNTDYDMNNVVVIIDVETTTLRNKGKYKLTIPRISANAAYNVYQTIETDQNYEEITDLSYSVDGGLYRPLRNSNYYEKTDENNSYIAYYFFAVLGLIFTITVLLRGIKLERDRKEQIALYEMQRQRERDELEARAAYDASAKVELAKIELRKQEQQVKLKQAQADIEKAKNEKAKLDSQKMIYCSYCGSKIKPDSGKCPYCGGDVK